MFNNAWSSHGPRSGQDDDEDVGNTYCFLFLLKSAHTNTPIITATVGHSLGGMMIQPFFNQQCGICQCVPHHRRLSVLHVLQQQFDLATRRTLLNLSYTATNTTHTGVLFAQPSNKQKPHTAGIATDIGDLPFGWLLNSMGGAGTLFDSG